RACQRGRHIASDARAKCGKFLALEMQKTCCKLCCPPGGGGKRGGMSSFDYDQVSSHDDEAVRISGRIKWFDPGKGYGFIVPDEPGKTGLKDVLLHVTSLRQSGRESAL